MRPCVRSAFDVVLLSLGVCLGVSGPAVPHQLTVPFFHDDGGLMNKTDALPTLGGVAGFVAVRNTRGEDVTMYLVYSQADPSGATVTQQAVSFTLAAYDAVIFRPVKDDPVEGRGRAVPNVLPGLGGYGSLNIIWIGGPEMVGAIMGRYREISLGGDMCHVLL